MFLVWAWGRKNRETRTGWGKEGLEHWCDALGPLQCNDRYKSHDHIPSLQGHLLASNYNPVAVTPLYSQTKAGSLPNFAHCPVHMGCNSAGGPRVQVRPCFFSSLPDPWLLGWQRDTLLIDETGVELGWGWRVVWESSWFSAHLRPVWLVQPLPLCSQLYGRCLMILLEKTSIVSEEG